MYAEALGNGIRLEMVGIAGGSFLMGSPKHDVAAGPEERPQRKVTVQPFYLAKFPVTQEQWAQVASFPKIALELPSKPAFHLGAQRPVEQVSWYEAIEFCARLSQKTGQQYRLPSEAEWEYSARGKTTTPYHFGLTISPKLANYSSCGLDPSVPRFGGTTPVAHFNATNKFGLYDMHGNVWEWSADPWHEMYRVYFFNRAPSDGRVWANGNSDRYYNLADNIHILLKDKSIRVSRGGSWFNEPWFCRSACRHRMAPDAKYGHLGFRVCCSSL